MKKMLENFHSLSLSRSEMKEICGMASSGAECGGGQTIECSGGTMCGAQDKSATNPGSCYCFGGGGVPDFKICPER